MRPLRQLSVVVPTLDEVLTLPALFDSLASQRDITLQCVIADGGSADDSVALARQRGARIVRSGRGRGRQLNAGAAAAAHPWLLFLHADSQLTEPDQLAEALDTVATARRHTPSPPPAGHFALRFARGQAGHDMLFALLEAKSASNRPYSINGDQGLLIHRDDFAALGGYDESLALFEDQRIATRIFEHGRWLLLPHRLLTSARRFEAEGHAPRYALMALMMAMEQAGLLGGFVAEAGHAYAAQKDARRLRLAPFRAAALRQLRAAGLSRGLRGVMACGRLVRQNAWQLALLLDLVRHHDDGRWLHRYDRLLAPLLAHRGADALAGAAAVAALLAGPSLLDRG